MNSTKYIEHEFCKRHSGKWHVSTFGCFCDMTRLTGTLIGMIPVVVLESRRLAGELGPPGLGPIVAYDYAYFVGSRADGSILEP